MGHTEVIRALAIDRQNEAQMWTGVCLKKEEMTEILVACNGNVYVNICEREKEYVELTGGLKYSMR